MGADKAFTHAHMPSASPNCWFGVVVFRFEGSFPFALCKNHGVKSPNHQPVEGCLLPEIQWIAIKANTRQLGVVVDECVSLGFHDGPQKSGPSAQTLGSHGNAKYAQCPTKPRGRPLTPCSERPTLDPTNYTTPKTKANWS